MFIIFASFIVNGVTASVPCSELLIVRYSIDFCKQKSYFRFVFVSRYDIPSAVGD